MIGFVIKNEVVKGSGLGLKDLGFATAKVDFFTDNQIKEGCYQSKILVDGELYLGITNITFNKYYISETHIISFDKDIYGKNVEITLLYFLRCKIISKDLKSAKTLIEDDIKRFWKVEPSCYSCKFFVAQDYGYSNYTVEGTNHDCLVNEHKGFIPKYGHHNAHICPYLPKGGYWALDVDGYEEKPTEEWFKAEYRNVILERLINEK